MTVVQTEKSLLLCIWLSVIAWMSLPTCITPVAARRGKIRTTGHCELTQHGTVIININETIFNLSSVGGFCVLNQTGIDLDKILCFSKPHLIPTCGHLHKNASWCFEEMLSGSKVIAITGKYVMVEIANLTNLHISHFTAMLEVNGEHDIRPWVCSLFLNHTLVEDPEKNVEKNSTGIITTSTSASPSEPKSSTAPKTSKFALSENKGFGCFIAVLAVLLVVY